MRSALLLCCVVQWALAGSTSPPCLGFDSCPPFPQPYDDGTYPDTYSYDGHFPDGFQWGLGTASYQIEGGYREDGRGASIWDTFTGSDTVGMPGSVCSSTPCPIAASMFARGATGNVANDHYHRYEEDVKLMQMMGLKHYRFSIAWPRVVPTGNVSEGVNEKGLEFYDRLIDALLRAGIQPMVTLYHWDLPQGLLQPDKGRLGWYSTDSAGAPDGWLADSFSRYADICFARFGDRVKTWITFNEPWTFTFLASGFGKAPSLDRFSDMKVWPYVAAHNVLIAHAAVVALYRSKYQSAQGGLIGITNNVDWTEPRTHAPADVGAAERMTEFGLAWFTDPIWLGDYPSSMRRVMGSGLPVFTAAQRQAIKGSADFFGLNSYSCRWAVNSSEAGPGQQYATITEDGFPRAQSSWLYGAGWGIRKLLNWIKRRYDSPPIIVTEGGWSIGADNATVGRADHARTLYYANYTSEIWKAIYSDKVDVRGYFAWSLMDNFEWERGYTERFGVVFNDFGFGFDPRAPTDPMHQPTANQTRTRKDSSRWLEEVWRRNALVDPAPFQRRP